MPVTKPSQDMYDFFMLLSTVVLIALIVGLFAPKKVIFWKKETATRKDVLLWYFGALVVLSVIGNNYFPIKGTQSETLTQTVREEKPEIPLTQAQKDSLLEAQKKAQAIEDANKQVAELEALAAQRREKADKCFSSWDGSHMELVRTVKAGMNDPSSFEHVKTAYAVSVTGIVTVRMSFRGKNGYGALMLQTVEAETNLGCEVLSVKQLE